LTGLTQNQVCPFGFDFLINCFTEKKKLKLCVVDIMIHFFFLKKKNCSNE